MMRKREIVLTVRRKQHVRTDTYVGLRSLAGVYKPLGCEWVNGSSDYMVDEQPVTRQQTLAQATLDRRDDFSVDVSDFWLR